VRAPEFARAHGEWAVLERAPGIRQWVFRGKPLYINTQDVRPYSLEGSDTPGWHNVYTQIAPPPPADFTTHETEAGIVLADKKGKTVYFYNCGDDSVDQLACDHPDTTQAYRFAVCGGGDAAVCLKNFPPVLASRNAKSTSRAWSIVSIDPKTGHFAKADDPAALRVWAYRDRPLYTYSKDEQPGDMNAEGLGEFRSHRHGFIAFWIRDDFYGRENQ
jgi:predicted lipoprotein with Yx(FWY)xxD motif